MRKNSIRLIPIKYVIGSLVLLLLAHAYTAYAMLSYSTASTSAQVFTLASSYNHTMLNGLLYTPAFALVCTPVARHIFKTQSVCRRGVIASLTCLRNKLLVISIAQSCLLIAGMLFQTMLSRLTLEIPVGYIILLGLSYVVYFLTCSFIFLIVIELHNNLRIAMLVVVAYGLFTYFMGMSPLRDFWLFQIGCICFLRYQMPSLRALFCLLDRSAFL